MARLPRYIIPGQPQHIIQRGNNRQAIFKTDDDYAFFRDAVIEASTKHDLAVHAYVWMTNHIHLLATPGAADSISKVFQSVGRKYVQYFNHTHKRSGTLWEGRFRATVVDSEQYLLTVMRYIELNPVRADGASARLPLVQLRAQCRRRRREERSLVGSAARIPAIGAYEPRKARGLPATIQGLTSQR
jgi:REP element-mobilizing transposase RayT